MSEDDYAKNGGEEHFTKIHTLWSLIDGGVGIVGGVGKISKINSRGGWNNRGGWKKSQKLIAMTSQISLESLNLSWVHRILLCSFCLAWNSLPELISGGVGIRMSWVENFPKINKRGGGDVY